MATLRSTVIMKTDIYEFTPRARTLSEAELSDLLNRQKALTAKIAVGREGVIVKGEGDSFWLVFPSVTAAALAAIELQRELQTTQSGLPDEKRLALRAVIALGDVLHQDNDVFGDAVNLTARIETVTPKDEIYLSQSAWLALNKNEVKSSYVDDFTLKGVNEPVKIYRVEQKTRTRIIKDQVICYSDVGKFSRFNATHPVEDSENLLIFLDDTIKRVSTRYGGEAYVTLADAQILAFPDPGNALSAMTELYLAWTTYVRQHAIDCGLHIGVHRGDLNIFRSHLYGDDVNRAASLTQIRPPQLGSVSIIVSGAVYQAAQDAEWQNRLEPLEENLYYLNVKDV